MQISVAMCTYNGAHHLREQLRSIADQSRQPDELVVCDDDSNDGTREILNKFVPEVPFPVRLYFNPQRLGSTKNFANAIGLCNGEVIALSDQDDFWLPEKLKLQEAILESDPDVGMVFSDAAMVDEDLQPLGYRLWQYLKFDKDEQKLFRGGKAFELLLARNIVVGATLAFRSKLIDLILPIPDEFELGTADGRILIHDGWISLLISAVAKVAIIDEQLIKYRQHSGQQVGTTTFSEEPVTEGVEGLRIALNRENFYATEIAQLSAVSERLKEKVPALSQPALAKLKSKIAHLKTRADMPDRRSHRLSHVLREVLTFRYHLYSHGVRSAAKDLFNR